MLVQSLWKGFMYDLQCHEGESSMKDRLMLVFFITSQEISHPFDFYHFYCHFLDLFYFYFLFFRDEVTKFKDNIQSEDVPLIYIIAL